MRTKSLGAFIAWVLATFCSAGAMAQTNRITQPVDNRLRTVLTGNLHPKALPANDQGRVAPSLAMPYITLTLAPSANQQADLEKLLVEQQTPGSPNYHHWLTPEEYGQRFGVSDADLSKITQWLQQQGLQVVSVARGRNWIAVSGTAAQVESAFQTEIHSYLVDGETHYANASEPSVPAAFGSVVKGIRGLNDFRMKPRLRASPAQPADTKPELHDRTRRRRTILRPAISQPFTTSRRCTPPESMGPARRSRSPDRSRSIFPTSSSSAASSICRPTIRRPLLVPDRRNPGNNPKSGDLAESDLDLEWSGAVAPNASIIFVYSTDVMTSVQYAIDQNLAPVVSVSYGSCELETPSSEYNAFVAMGAASQRAGNYLVRGLGRRRRGGLRRFAKSRAGRGPAGQRAGSDQRGRHGVRRGYGHIIGTPPTTPTAHRRCLTFRRPPGTIARKTRSRRRAAAAPAFCFRSLSWQTGPGVPSDNARHVPDIALNASDDHDAYLVYTSGSLQLYGGTSLSTPSFAGLTALLNQKLGSAGVGNINPKLYSLAQSSPGIFHDVTTGNNIVTVACSRRQPDCADPAVGYYAGVGYDQTTGLGSVDAYKLVMGWNGGSTTPPPVNPDTSVTLLSNLSTVASNDVVYLTATVTSTDGNDALRVGLVFDRRDFVGNGRLDRIGGDGDRDAGGERLAVAVGQRNDYGNVQRHQQRIGDGERDGVRIGIQQHAGDHQRRQWSQLQARLRAGIGSQCVRIQPVAGDTERIQRAAAAFDLGRGGAGERNRRAALLRRSGPVECADPV